MASANGRPIEVSPGIYEPNWMRSALGGPVLLYLKLLHETPVGHNRWRDGDRVGTRALADECGISRGNIRRWLATLERVGWIRVSRNRDGVAVVIRKRKWWRGRDVQEVEEGGAENGPPRAKSGPPPGPEMAHPRAKSGPPPGQIRPTNASQVATEHQLENRPANSITPIIASKDTAGLERPAPTPLESLRERSKAMLARYEGLVQVSIREAVDRCRAARKNGKVAPSVILAQLEYLARYSPAVVENGTRRFLERDGIAGNPEAYWRGCVRGASREEGRNGD